MEILDAQVINHSRSASGLPRFPMAFDDGYNDSQRDAIAVELALAAMDACGVDAALWHGELPLAQAAVARAPDRLAGVVYFADDPPDVTAAVGAVAETEGLVGIRLSLAWPTTGEKIVRVQAGGYDPWFRTAQEAGVPLALFVSGYLDVVGVIARRFPELSIVVDHLGMPSVPIMPRPADPWADLPGLLRLAVHPCVAVKLTGVPALSELPYPFPDLWPHVHQVLKTFGLERVMWGSDYMRCRGLHTYAEAGDFIRRTDELAAREKEQLLSRSARTWFRWTGDASTRGGEGDEAFLQFAREAGNVNGS